MLKLIVGVIIVLLALFFAECWRELQFFKMTHYKLCVSKFSALSEEKKLVVLADLHNKVYGDDNEKLLGAIRSEHPDIILIPGDMIVSKGEGIHRTTLEFVARLPEICPVFYSLGNHEQRVKERPEKYGETAYKEYKEKLVEAGVHLLENESAEFMLDKLCVRVYGLELPLDTYDKFKKKNLSEGDMETYAGRPVSNKYQILLAHNPVYFPVYKTWGADLTVSGHLHGGIVRIPGLGGAITPQAALFPKYSGEMTVEEEQAIVVSRGLGTHTINLRFCNYAEAVVIHLVPYEKPCAIHGIPL